MKSSASPFDSKENRHSCCFLSSQLGYSLLGQSIENSDFEVNAKGFLAEYYQLDKSDSTNSEGKTLKNKKYKKKV